MHNKTMLEDVAIKYIQTAVDGQVKPEVILKELSAKGYVEEEIRPALWSAIIHAKSQNQSVGGIIKAQARTTQLLLTESFIVYKQKASKFLVLTITFTLSFVFASSINSWTNMIIKDSQVFSYGIYFLSFIFNIFVLGCLYNLTIDTSKNIPIASIFRKTISQFKKLFILFSLAAIPFLFAKSISFLLHDPGASFYKSELDNSTKLVYSLNLASVIALVFWTLSPYILINEKTSPINAYKRSFYFIKKYFSDIIWSALELGLIFIALVFIPILGPILISCVFIPIYITYYWIFYRGLLFKDSHNV